MLRILFWMAIFYVVYRVLQSITIVRRHVPPPPFGDYTDRAARNSPPQPPQPAQSQNPPLGAVQDAEFEELPPDPPKGN